MSAQKADIEHSIPIAPNGKTIAFIQLNRLGDILQTLGVARELKTQRPEIRTILICREMFGKQLLFLLKEYFNEVHFIAGDLLLNGSVHGLDDIIANLDQKISQIQTHPIDVLINFSFSKSSALLTSLISAQHKFGLTSDMQAQNCLTDQWSQYIYACVMSGAYNQIALNDIFNLILGLKSNGTSNKPENSHSQKIIVAPFASHHKKMWRPEKWVEVIYKTLKTNGELEIHLIGAKDEQDAVETILKNPLLAIYKSRLINHVGKKTLQETAELIKDARLLVGHDSMASHLAAFFNVQTLTISLGTVRALETAPYRSHSYVLTPKTKCYPCFPETSCTGLQCHSDISYHVVISSLQSLIDEQKITSHFLKENLSSFHLSTFGVYETGFNSNGLLSFKALNENDFPSLSHIIGNYYRMAWLYLCEEIEDEMPLPKLSEVTMAQLKQFQDGVKYLYELYHFGQDYSRYILEEIAQNTPDLSKIKNYGIKIDEIDQLSLSLKKTYPHIEPLCNFIQLKKENLGGGHIVQLTQETFFTYNQGVLLCKVLHELIESSLKDIGPSRPTTGQNIDV